MGEIDKVNSYSLNGGSELTTQKTPLMDNPSSPLMTFFSEKGGPKHSHQGFKRLRDMKSCIVVEIIVTAWLKGETYDI